MGIAFINLKVVIIMAFTKIVWSYLVSYLVLYLVLYFVLWVVLYVFQSKQTTDLCGLLITTEIKPICRVIEYALRM